jgi:magnesium chelatase family protein
MLFKTLSAAVYGIDASIIEVEVDVSGIKMMEDHFNEMRLSHSVQIRCNTPPL